MCGLVSFPQLPVMPPLAAALARRGYETATAVQAAVLAPALAGRDLMVSSQTGSGKTVAFGTLIADSLLVRGAAAPADKAPRALVVAPTRELANQVSGELEWLFADAKMRLGAFTGGTDVGRDLRKLRTGIDIAVGTPGRLVDLHRRKALVLSSLQVLVLDEADEMLDLGFKEDLEYLLGSAPKERRTLLFSATIPRDIERMAATYQREAQRVDPRPKGAAAPHADISFVGHLVRREDRLAAVVNVLLAAGDAKAILFCRTREGVGELHQRLVDHGFRAAAIAGDRAQGERDRAIDALRTGRARVLVATNVAARGLDLPDVEIVVHADLPENADALTHRSGRTGRAGKKGTSVVIADLAERRKAERLLSSAGVTGGWTPPPGETEVRRALHERFARELLDEATKAASGDGPMKDGLEALADRLRAALPERVLLGLLLGREVARLPPPLPLRPVELERRRENAPRLDVRARIGTGAAAPSAKRPPPGAKRPVENAAAPTGPRPGWVRAVIFRVNLGAEAKAEPGWLLPLICRRGGVTRKEVGSIRVGPRSSTFEIAADAADDFALSASESDPRAPHVIIEAANHEVAGAAPPERDQHGGAPPRARKPGPSPHAKPAFAKPAFAKPAFSRPAFSKPAFAKSGFSKPTFAKRRPKPA